MARSVNPYATTLFYANVLEDMSKIDEAGETSEIPAWIRALFVMERNFDGWNEALREKLLANQVTLAKNFDARKLAEYRDSVSELNVRPCVALPRHSAHPGDVACMHVNALCGAGGNTLCCAGMRRGPGRRSI